MLIWESISIALKALMSNKMRTILTMLGIIIGVGAVIALVSIGNGVRAEFNQQFSDLGSNVMWVMSGSARFGGRGVRSDRESQRAAIPLTMADAALIGTPWYVANVSAVAPEYRPNGVTMVRDQGEQNVQAYGVTPEYEPVRNYTVTAGRFITDDDVNKRGRVVVLSEFLVSELFQTYEYPIGEQVRLNGTPYEVVGVFEDKAQSGFGGESEDTSIMVPITTAQTRLGRAGVHDGSPVVGTIYLQVVSIDMMADVTDQVTRLMRERHGLEGEAIDDFSVISQSDLLEFGNTFANGLTAFLGAIAGISLLVGGIGIMNIMLVSVTERTREIGIRKAVGAKRRDILLQFLVESIVLSLIGGFIGISLGYGVSTLLPLILPQQFSQTVVNWQSVLVATIFSMAIGLFFGVYPAMRAARLKPIDALRYE